MDEKQWKKYSRKINALIDFQGMIETWARDLKKREEVEPVQLTYPRTGKPKRTLLHIFHRRPILSPIMIKPLPPIGIIKPALCVRLSMNECTE